MGMEPVDAFYSLLKDDLKKFNKSTEDSSQVAKMADRCLVMDLYLIRGWYKRAESWSESLPHRMVIAQGTSAFNLLLLARHAIELGYLPESGSVMRQAHEAATRALVIPHHEEVARHIASGRQVSQVEIDKKLADLTSDDADEALNTYRANYRRASANVHPNIEWLSIRNPKLEPDRFSDVEHLADVVGLDAMLGGVDTALSKFQGYTLLASRGHELATALFHEFANYNSMGYSALDDLWKSIEAAFEVLAHPDLIQDGDV